MRYPSDVLARGIGSTAAMDRVGIGCQQVEPAETADQETLPSAKDRTDVDVSEDAPMSPDALAALAVLLHANHPTATAAMVRRSIDDAVTTFRTARIRRYLPILIERAAWEVLRKATTTDDCSATPGLDQR